MQTVRLCGKNHCRADRADAVREESEGTRIRVTVTVRVCVCVSVQRTRARLTVSSVINRVRTASFLSHTDTVWSLMRPGEAWNDEMKSSLYQHVTGGILNVSLHLHNCFQLLQMLQAQRMVMDDNDNGYLMMMMPFTCLWFGWNSSTLQQLKKRALRPRRPEVRGCKSI